MRLRCKAFGCVWGESIQCLHCGTWLYEGEILRENCWLAPLYRLAGYRWKALHRCKVCDKFMFFSGDWCCSPECLECWDDVPF